MSPGPFSPEAIRQRRLQTQKDYQRHETYLALAWKRQAREQLVRDVVRFVSAGVLAGLVLWGVAAAVVEWMP